MTKVKDIKTKSARRKAKITVKSLIADVRKKLNKEKVEAVMNLLEKKYRELEQAKIVVKKINKQIQEIENKDIEEIETENLHQESRIKFNGVYCRWRDILRHIYTYLPLSCQGSEHLMDLIRAIDEENIFIPLDFIKSSIKPNDKPGCRILDWKVLATSQIKKAMRLNIPCQEVRFAVQAQPFSFRDLDGMSGEELATHVEFEEYNKVLNVSYLVSDKFLERWTARYYEEKNIAKKQVKDCSVSELLFAIKKKLDKQRS